MEADAVKASLDPDAAFALERRLVLEAAKLADPAYRSKRAKQTGSGEEVAAATGEAELNDIAYEISDFAAEGIEIAPHAESTPVLPLYQAAGAPLPPDLRTAHEQQQYDFYCVEVVWSHLLAAGQFLTEATLKLTLQDDITAAVRRARPVAVFPQSKDKHYFGVDVQAQVALTASADFALATPIAAVGAEAQVGGKVVLRPMSFGFRRAAIEVRATSSPRMVWRWRLKSELDGANEMKVILLVKVASEARDLRLHVEIGATPARRRWLIFRDLLPALPGQPQVLPVELAHPVQ